MLSPPKRSLVPRIWGTLCGFAIAGDGLRECWSAYRQSIFHMPDKHLLYMNMAFRAPLISWGLALLFFALLARSTPLRDYKQSTGETE
ncbi:hypothetical protein EON83_21695 [bacterium]|nr:MAG: hypothetical protein EON83_21695 [bacterium]